MEASSRYEENCGLHSGVVGRVEKLARPSSELLMPELIDVNRSSTAMLLLLRSRKATSKKKVGRKLRNARRRNKGLISKKAHMLVSKHLVTR